MRWTGFHEKMHAMRPHDREPLVFTFNGGQEVEGSLHAERVTCSGGQIGIIEAGDSSQHYHQLSELQDVSIIDQADPISEKHD